MTNTLNTLDLLSIDDVCELLCIGRNAVYTLLHAQAIKAFRIGRVWKIPAASVYLYICENANLPKTAG